MPTKSSGDWADARACMLPILLLARQAGSFVASLVRRAVWSWLSEIQVWHWGWRLWFRSLGCKTSSWSWWSFCRGRATLRPLASQIRDLMKWMFDKKLCKIPIETLSHFAAVHCRVRLFKVPLGSCTFRSPTGHCSKFNQHIQQIAPLQSSTFSIYSTDCPF